MRKLTTIFALVSATFPSAAWPQTVDQYGYDAKGRLIRVESGRGNVTNYVFDSADNRIQLVDADVFQTFWNGQNPALGHSTGFPDLNGWAVNIYQATGYMIYGPYTALSAGNYAASWRIMIDNNIDNDVHVASLGVYDATASEQLASLSLTRKAWKGANAFQLFSLPFTVNAARARHVFEFRVYYHGGTYLAVNKVGYWLVN
jgi:YD repeat-containing protein